MDKYKTKITFSIKSTSSFSVEAVGWPTDNYDGDFKPCGVKWNWNIYAYIFEDHPLFSDVEKAMGLPFNCGATLDKLITTAPARGIEHDFQSITKTLKLGSDYGHIYDDYDNHPSPFDGLPNNIERDALDLVEALENTSPKKEEDKKD